MRKTGAVVLLIVIGVLSLESVQAQTQTSDQKYLADLRSSYAVLKRQGLVGLRATVVPNWTATFKDVPIKDRAALLRVANRLRFNLEVDETGNFHVTHAIVGPRPAKAAAGALDDIAKGVDLSITGFMMTWAPFMLTYLIPDNLEQFVLQDLDSQKVLTYKEREVAVSLTLTKDFEIKELSTQQGSVKPVLRRDKSGFVLTGYEGNNDDPIVGKVVINAKIRLAPVQGLLLPKTVFLNGKSGATPINFELNFLNYRLKRKG
ncbi:MAG TPA: hypothetical protein VI306_05215 [Pyrinomonadaceae bacterium]